jgi:hypothetical protein
MSKANFHMTQFRLADHVRWNSEVGYVRGRKYEIKNARAEHIAMHKGSALSRIGS